LLVKAQKPATATDVEWREYIGKESSRAWTIIATSYYEKEKWKEAINAYQKILSYSRKNDVAYYRIGLCYWKLEDPDQAIDNFAICYALDGTMAKSSYDYLERLYKALHNGTTVGLKRVLDEARAKVKGF
jgi:tetratricopeptide (TPR) repeat protein